MDLGSGKSVTENGMVSRVVKDLTLPFSGFNHVLYMDNFFNSGPLVEQLAEDKIFVAGTIKERAVRFPDTMQVREWVIHAIILLKTEKEFV